MIRTMWTVVFGVALATMAPGASASPPTESAQRLQVPVPQAQDGARAEVEAVRRRVEVLARSGRVGQAIELLELREDERGELESSLSRRLARLYRDTGRWEDLAALLLRGVDGEENDLDIGQSRLLAEARYELGRTAEARATLDRLIDRNPGDTSLRRMVANVLGQRGRRAEAIEVLVEGRRISGDPLDFAQLLARFHAQLGQMPDAVREYCKVIVASPLNVSLVRGQILELASDAPQQVGTMLEVARAMAARHRDVPQIGIVVAELEMRAGDPDAAWNTLARLVGEPELTQEMLRLALAGLADSRLPDTDPDRVLPRLRLSARVARAMLANESVPASLEPRVYDTLVRSLLAMLENDAFGRLDRDAQFDILDETRRSIVEMQERFAGNRLTASALLRLAGVYVDALHEPEPAIELYELLSVNTSSSREEVNLARLGLARAHVAEGDTATAREMFESIGQDMDFVEGQGRAQYHLGMIDFMG
ncbi:MAG TPA: tetratricopeptide repeat protein, partial [Candidatus Krumholzibacteria bacterium]|nr:tetratricopeptide repeat protein [Candidatus Krumholzibacteria bacterium]